MAILSSELLQLSRPAAVEEVTDCIINQDFRDLVPLLPRSFVDLLVLDPPYNS